MTPEQIAQAQALGLNPQQIAQMFGQQAPAAPAAPANPFMPAAPVAPAVANFAALEAFVPTDNNRGTVTSERLCSYAEMVARYGSPIVSGKGWRHTFTVNGMPYPVSITKPLQAEVEKRKALGTFDFGMYAHMDVLKITFTDKETGAMNQFIGLAQPQAAQETFDAAKFMQAAATIAPMSRENAMASLLAKYK
jgi:hypothetical protein